MVNGYRSGEGLPPVALHAALDQIATERGRQISEEGGFFHDWPYLKTRFDQLGIDWCGFGEIIALNGSGSFASFGDQWWRSTSGHHDIMLGDYTHAAGSREQRGNTWYGVMIFVDLCHGDSSPSGFGDIASSPFKADIEWLVSEKITAGCTPLLFCPKSAVTREQMASFVTRALNLPAAGRDYFTDDGRSIHQDAINRMAAAGLTTGCGGGRYCPTSRITRGEMASFLDRALDLPSTGADQFTDDNSSVHESAINRLAAAGLVAGCSADRFCPTASVTRGQMAAFLHRAFR